MSMDATTIFQGAISRYERILWSGQPKQGFVIDRMELIAIPLLLPWSGFILVMMISSGMADAIESRSFIAFIEAIIFILAALYFGVGRFFVDVAQRQRSYYAVTNESVVIVEGLFARKVTKLNLRTLPVPWLYQRKDGSGTIVFKERPPFWGKGYLVDVRIAGISRLRRYGLPVFELIENVTEVYALIQKAQLEIQGPRV